MTVTKYQRDQFERKKYLFFPHGYRGLDPLSAGSIAMGCGEADGHSGNPVWRRKPLTSWYPGRKGLRMWSIHVLSDLLCPSSPHTLVSLLLNNAINL